MRTIRRISAFLSVFTALFAAATPARAASEHTLSFDDDGYFTLLLVSAVEETPGVCPYYTSALTGVLSDYDADMVVFLGDQLDGSSPLYAFGKSSENVRRAALGVLRPVTDRALPFAVLFGRTDEQTGVPVSEQLALYRSLPGCQNTEKPDSLLNYGDCILPVYSADGKTVLLNLILLSDPQPPDPNEPDKAPAQRVWFLEESAKAAVRNGDVAIPSAVFLNRTLPEIYDALDVSQSSGTDSFSGLGNNSDSRFLFDSEDILLGELNEAPSPAEGGHGLFAALQSEGNAFSVFFGGEHRNTFLTATGGIDLVSVPSASYAVANSRETRGVRLVRFSADNVQDYETIHVPFSAYEKLSLLDQIPYYLLTATHLTSFWKIVLLALAAAIGIASLFILDAKRKGVIPPPYEDGKEDIPRPS